MSDRHRSTRGSSDMIVSIEVPVFKGGWIRPCVESVLGQSSPNWRLSLFWDGGDEQSRMFLEYMERRGDPRISVHFSENKGIARARQYLSEHSSGDFILPLDDDDALPFHTVERFLDIATTKPWASIIRAKRKFIDLEGTIVDQEPWFPFELRHYQHGMVTDVFNHSQPYLMRRSAFERTAGWEGFEDFMYAGEDCDIYLKLEEQGSVELLEDTLYYYRINPERASDVLTPEAAFEMWRRLADKTVTRIGLPLKRTNESVPFQYERQPRPQPTLDMVDFVVLPDRGSREQTESMMETLTGCDISDDAIHVASSSDDNVSERNRLFETTSRPLLCFIVASMCFDDVGKMNAMLASMHTRLLDLASPVVAESLKAGAGDRPGITGSGAPTGAAENMEDKPSVWLSEKMLVVRREVLRAVGGFDEGFEQPRNAVMDLYLKARQRRFACERVGEVAFQCREPGVPVTESAPSDTRRLEQKWASYPELLSEGTDHQT